MLTSRMLGESGLHACVILVCSVTLFVAFFRRATTKEAPEKTPSAATTVPVTSLEMAHAAAEQAEESLEEASINR